MASRIADLADALTTNLNAQSFEIAFVAARSWQPVYDLDELATLRVSVIPRTRTSRRSARNQDENDHTLNVVFQKHATEADVDALAELVEEVADHLTRLHLAIDGHVHPSISVAIDPVCALDDLDEQQTFTSVLAVAFREWRATG